MTAITVWRAEARGGAQARLRLHSGSRRHMLAPPRPLRHRARERGCLDPAFDDAAARDYPRRSRTTRPERSVRVSPGWNRPTAMLSASPRQLARERRAVDRDPLRPARQAWHSDPASGRVGISIVVRSARTGIFETTALSDAATRPIDTDSIMQMPDGHSSRAHGSDTRSGSRAKGPRRGGRTSGPTPAKTPARPEPRRRRPQVNRATASPLPIGIGHAAKTRRSWMQATGVIPALSDADGARPIGQSVRFRIDIGTARTLLGEPSCVSACVPLVGLFVVASFMDVARSRPHAWRCSCSSRPWRCRQRRTLWRVPGAIVEFLCPVSPSAAGVRSSSTHSA